MANNQIFIIIGVFMSIAVVIIVLFVILMLTFQYFSIAICFALVRINAEKKYPECVIKESVTMSRTWKFRIILHSILGYNNVLFLHGGITNSQYWQLDCRGHIPVMSIK